MLSIQNLYVFVGDRPILKGLALDAPVGEALTVMRPNGAGKSMPWYDAGVRRLS